LSTIPPGFRELETAANTYRGIYETFLSRFTQSVQQQSFPSTEARVVTFASPPRGPSSPKISLTLALGSALRLGLGIMSALAREQMNRQIHTRAQLEKTSGNQLSRRSAGICPEETCPSQAAGNAGFPGHFGRSARSRHFSATAEALRYIKVAIDLHPTGGKVIGIVSALPAKEKRRFATGFAAFVAKSGARTLLIDADLRNPSMTRALGYINAPGLVKHGCPTNRTLPILVITDSKFQI